MTEIHGDAELAGELRAALSHRHEVAAMATVAPSGTRVAALGARLNADFELGSLSKAITGLLYSDAVARDEIDPSTTLGDLLPLDGTPAADVTLSALSTHSAGLPRLPRSSGTLRRTWAWWRSGANPYGDDLDALLEQARQTRVGRSKPLYSNFGFELLGHALARAARTSYAELVQQRIAAPLDLGALYAPAVASDVVPGAVTGRNRRGKEREPWTGEAVAPAGGLRASIADMATLTEALLDGTAPGMAALEPIAPFAGRRKPVTIGAAWITLDHDGRLITWHNGATGGFSSWLGLDREAGTGVALLSATAASVTGQGFTFLADLTGAQR